jgi:hypothetical protein
MWDNGRMGFVTGEANKFGQTGRFTKDIGLIMWLQERAG